MKSILWALQRDLALALRSRAEVLLILVFFILIASLFPLATSPQSSLLKQIGPGVAWVSALLAILLSLPRLFAADHADGTLEQMLMSPAPLAAIIAGKVLAHWISNCLPLILTTPLIGVQFGLSAREIAVLSLAIALGSPILVWLGAMTSALTLGARGGGALLALLVLPLAVPVLIFGAGAVEADLTNVNGQGARGHFSLLGAGFLLVWVFGPWVTALAVRIAHE